MAELFYHRFIGDLATDVNLSDTTPTNVYDSGATGWEYTGDQSDYRIRDYSVLTCSAAFDQQVARLNAAFDHTRLEMWSNTFKLGVDNAADNLWFAFFVPNTAIGTFDNRVYLRVGISRIGIASIRSSIQWVQSDGTVTTLATGRAISYPLNSQLKLFATVDSALAIASIYVAESDGAMAARLIGRATIPSAVMVAGNDRVGVVLTSSNPAGGTGLIDLHIRDAEADMVPFPFRFNWPMQEGYGFLTDVLTADDGTEQRVAVRNPDKPRRTFRLPLVTIDRDDTEQLLALVFGSNLMTVWVPEWWNACVLSANTAIGATTLPVADTTNREFNTSDDLTEPARYILIWSAPDTWEIHIVDTTGPTNVNPYWPTLKAWTAGTTFILPIYPAHLGESVEVLRHARHMAEAELEFLVDA